MSSCFGFYIYYFFNIHANYLLNVLFSLGANVNCQALDKATPLFIAAQEGHTTCVELLLSSGADPDLYCNEDNWQLPIHAAAQMGHTK